MAEFEQDVRYFEANKDTFRGKYSGKEIVISGGAVVGVYDTPQEAYHSARAAMNPGTFIIQTVYANAEDEEESILP